MSEIILEKLTLEEKIKILQAELIRVKNKIAISKLVYSLHGCDSYEDEFRDNIPKLEDICKGIKIALRNLINLEIDDGDSE